MTNFFRAVRMAFRYRWTLICAFVCSLLVAVLWGANISAVYPFVEVTLRGHSLHAWIDEEIQNSAARLDEIDQKIQQLKEQAASADAPHDEGQQQLAALIADRRAEQRALQYSRRLQPVVHAWMPSDPYVTLVIVVCGLLIGTLFKNAFLMGNAILVERASRLTLLNLRKEFFRKALDMDLGNLGNDGPGELTSRFTYDMNTLVLSMRSLFGRATVEPLKMAVCLILAGCICWRLLLFSLILAPPAVLIIQRLAGSIKRANRRAMEEMSRLVGQLSESLGAIEVVKAFTMESYERGRFHDRAKAFYDKSMQIIFYNSLTRPATELLGIGVISVALLAGAYLVIHQETHIFGIRMTDRPLSLPAIMAFFALLAGVSDPARKLADIYNLIQPGLPAGDRVFGMIDREVAILDPPHPQPVPAPHRQLIFENVSFAYGEGPVVLRDIDLTVPAGETLAIVGPNGCGKTTLVNMIPRFFDPTSGKVRLDHVNVRDVLLRDLRLKMGLVTQHTQLFDGTVLNNIRYGCLDATREQVIEAAQAAHAHRFIEERLENGYETVVGPGGGRLSGGQRQRIALARAILRNPEILILDEATSQVDLESEQLIHKVLEKFVRDRTAIIITHRLSTLALANRILVMDGGQIVDVGTHEQLLGRCSLYQRLYEIQFKQIA